MSLCPEEQEKVSVEGEVAVAEWGEHDPEPDQGAIVFVLIAAPRFPIREGPPAIA